MVYFLESNIPDNKSVQYSLAYVYGVGRYQASIIIKRLGFAKNLKVKNLTKEQLAKLIKLSQILDFDLASDLKKKQILNYKTTYSPTHLSSYIVDY